LRRLSLGLGFGGISLCDAGLSLQADEVITVSSLALQLSKLAQASNAFYALIDLANCANPESVLARMTAGHAECVLGDLRREAQLASPWLWRLRGESLSDTSWTWIARTALQRSCMTWLVTDHAEPGMLHRLRVRTDAELADRQAVLLRYFDPRVLPVLHQILRPEQREAFFSICTSWHFVDRTGKLKTLSASPSSADSLLPPVKLDDSQFAGMLRAAEVDAVIPELVREAPNQFLALAPADRVAFTQRCLQDADDAAIHSHAHRVLWCLAALEFGAKFMQGPVWSALVVQVSNGEMSMAQAIQEATTEVSHAQ
jgi:hypothetical protein